MSGRVYRRDAPRRALGCVLILQRPHERRRSRVRSAATSGTLIRKKRPEDHICRVIALVNDISFWKYRGEMGAQENCTTILRHRGVEIISDIQFSSNERNIRLSDRFDVQILTSPYAPSSSLVTSCKKIPRLLTNFARQRSIRPRFIRITRLYFKLSHSHYVCTICYGNKISIRRDASNARLLGRRCLSVVRKSDADRIVARPEITINSRSLCDFHLHIINTR